GGVGGAGGEFAGEGARCRIVEDQCGRQPQTGRGGEPVAQFHGGEGVESQLLEGLFVVQGVASAGAEDEGDGAPYEVDGGLVAVGGRERGELVGEGPGGVAGVGGAAADGRGADQASQQRGYVTGGAYGGEVEAHGCDDGQGGAQGQVEEFESEVGGQRQGARALHPFDVGVGEVGGHAAALLPQSPGEGEGGESLGAPVLGEGVEDGVGGGVVALCGGGQDARVGGEEHECREVPVAGEIVQVDGGVGLGPQDAGQSLGGEGPDEGVVEDAGGVHDAGERVLVGY